ncbi:MAG: alanine racemase [Pseudomonadota bacterium]
MTGLPTLSTTPRADINLDALCRNYEALKTLAPAAETSAVVKCDAYGLGMIPVAKALAERTDCRIFFVAYAQEGAELRAALNPVLPDAQIYVFNGPTPDTVDIFDDAMLTPVINSQAQAELWTRQEPRRPVALHIDTGMNRLGAPISEVEQLAAAANFSVDLVMSHLAWGADPAHPMNKEQKLAFESIIDKFPNARASLSASAGILMGPPYHYDVTRPGVALYGGSPFGRDEHRVEPVVTLTAPVIQLRDLKAGESVGYNATFVASKPMRVATLAYGYGDGFPVSGSNKASVYFHGEIAPIAGRVSMDLISIDVTDLRKRPSLGDRVEFFGPNNRLFETASACGTASYEILTRLGGRVDRRYL